MQWLLHTVRALFRRNALLGVVAVAAPIGMLAALAVVVVSQFGGGSAEAAPDPVSAAYTEDLLDRVGGTPESLVEDVVSGLLPFEASPEQSAAAVQGLANALDLPDATADAVADALIRRLGPVASEATSAEELIDLLIADIDPDGSIESVEELVAAVESWAARTSPHVLRLTSGAGEGALAGLDEMSFEAASAVLDSLPATMEVLDVTLGGVDGLGSMLAPGIRWEVDEPSRSIMFSGVTDGLGGQADLFVVARWSGRPTPVVLGGLRISEWRLANAGFSGALGDRPLPSTTFLLTDRPGVLSYGEVSAAAWVRLSADASTGATEIPIERGVNALTTIEGDALPDRVADLLTGTVNDPRLGVRAALGTGFGVVDGSAAPSQAMLAVEVPGLDPPALPSWVSPSDDLPWVLTLASAMGGELTIGLAGGLDVQLDGATRSFAGRFDLSADGNSASGRLVADLRTPWQAPFGVDWLDLDALTMVVDLGDDAGVARFESSLVVAQRPATLQFEVALAGESTSTRMLVEIDRLTAGDAVELLAAATGAAAPGEVPDLMIDDVVIDVRAGTGATVAIGGRATVVGQTADVLAGVESVGGGSPGVVLGVALDSWKLDEAVPAASGTLVGDLEFPPSALVLSSLDGSIDPADLSEPARRFFAGVEGAGSLRLTPGVSLFGSLDLRGTSLEAPLSALGFDDGQFPIVGTLPGSVIGLGGGSAGSPLSGLALAVELPEIAPGDTPDWFRGGRLSLVATGQPSLGLEGEMTVVIDGEQLTFVVGAEFARAASGVQLALFGALETDRPWEEPFGVEWLTVNDLALQLSIDPIGTVGLGFGGSVVLGEQDVDVAIATEISAAGVPTNFVFEGASAPGLAFSDLVALQNRMAGATGGSSASLSGYPDLAVKDIEIRFAPRPVERLGIEAGFAVVGDVWIDSGGSSVRFAALDVKLSEDGLTAAGSLRAYDLGPIAWSDVELDLALTAADQHFEFDGEAEVFGLRAGASVDLSSDSLFFAGRGALEDLRRAVDLFEQLVRDPIGTLDRIDEIFEAAGVPVPDWMSDLADAIETLTGSGASPTEDAVDIILNGGTIPLVTSPPNGEAPACLLTAPIEGDDGRCYTTPPIPATDGVPTGGDAKECSRLAPRESGGRCYTSTPKGKVCLASFEFLGKTYGMILRSDGRCYAKIPKVTGGYRYEPAGGLKATTDRGIPVGGDPKICRVETPLDVGGRCYTVPPTPAIDGIPRAGEPKGCKLWWTFEDGTCWRISPSQAARGLAAPGLCTQYDVSCRLEDLVSGDIARVLFDGVIERLDDW